MAVAAPKKGISAREAIARQQRADPDALREENPTAGIDIDSFMVDVVRDEKLDVDVNELVTGGRITRTMDGASHLEVTIRDTYRSFINSEVAAKAINLTLDKRKFRLVQMQKQETTVSPTFEDRIISWLRSKDDPRTGSRGSMTRAEFIRTLVKSVKQEGGIDFFCPELHKKQPIEGIKTEEKRNERREPGLTKSELLRVKGRVADREQVKNAEIVLDVGYDMNANRKVLISAIMTIIQESGMRNLTGGDRDSVGLFQQRPSQGWKGLRNRPLAAKEYFTRAIANDKANPNMYLWELCQSVQRSGYPKAYDAWKDEGKAFVEEYGATGGDTSFERRKQYQFTVGPPDGPKGENYWQAIQRLAEEVNWRVFVSNDRLYYCSDDYLIKQKPRYTLDEDTAGVNTISFDLDRGKVNDEVTIDCRAARWTAPPGSVVVLENCGPANGRWLVWEIERDLFSWNTTITLHRKSKAHKEPAPEIMTVAGSDSEEGVVTRGRVTTGEGIRERIVAVCERAYKDQSKYHYSHWRPAGGEKWTSLFSQATYAHGVDCSAFVEMVYMAAGARDPIGMDYRGGGYTGSQIQAGAKTAHPKPGDLCFYGPGQGPGGSPGHVAIYIGNGEVFSAGSNPLPKKLAVQYRNDFMGYWTYHLRPYEPNPVSRNAPSGPGSRENRPT